MPFFTLATHKHTLAQSFQTEPLRRSQHMIGSVSVFARFSLSGRIEELFKTCNCSIPEEKKIPQIPDRELAPAWVSIAAYLYVDFSFLASVLFAHFKICRLPPNGGPGVFLSIQRNYKEQAWLHFHNWASLPSTTAWLAPARGEIDSSVKAACLYFWEVGNAHSSLQVSQAFMSKAYYLLRFKGMSESE